MQSNQLNDLPLFIGLSLSTCVLHIAQGLVDENLVIKIIASTSFRSSSEFQDVLDSYSQVYWVEYPCARQIAERLFLLGKIEQPRLRLFNFFYHSNCSDGYWQRVF